MSRAILSVVILGLLSLGFSSVAEAHKSYVQWYFADKKLDCPSTCGETGLKFAMPTGVDRRTGKLSFYMCLTSKERGWRPGFNRNGEKSCVSAFDGKEYHGVQYYCLCTNNRRMLPIFN